MPSKQQDVSNYSPKDCSNGDKSRGFRIISCSGDEEAPSCDLEKISAIQLEYFLIASNPKPEQNNNSPNNEMRSGQKSNNSDVTEASKYKQNSNVRDASELNSNDSEDQREKKDEAKLNSNAPEKGPICAWTKKLIKFNRAKILKNTLSSIFRDKNGVNLKDPDVSKDKQLHLIFFLLWTFALRPGSKDQYVGKGPFTLLWQHVTLDSETLGVTLRFPTKGAKEDEGAVSSKEQNEGEQKKVKEETKIFSVSFTAPKEIFDWIKNSKPKDPGSNVHLFTDTFRIYLKETYGLKPKDFRTAAACFAFQTLLDGTPRKDTVANKKKFRKKCAEMVQKFLQHTTVGETTRDYLDPRITIAWYLKQKIKLPKSMESKTVRYNLTEEYRF